MTQIRSLTEIIGLLDQLGRSADLPVRQRDTAKRLHARLNAPVRVGVFGAVLGQSDALFQGLISAVGDKAVATTADTIQTDDLAIINRHACVGSQLFADMDIALWPSTNFDAAEAAIWSAASDRLKDHSFLIALYENGAPALDANCTWIDAAFDDFSEFLALPVHNNTAQAAPLLAALIKQARRGRQADHDSAEMLLEAFRDKIVFTAPIVAVAPVAAKTALVRTDVWQRASDALKSGGKELSSLSSSGDFPNPSAVLAVCIAASETLSDIFFIGTEDSPVQRRFREDVLLAADNIVLMSCEDNAASAIDATMTLLQLQKDIQLQLYRK